MEENNFKTGQEVLVRDDNRDDWCYSLYSHNQKDDDNNTWYVTVSDSWFRQCITYEGNEYLVGTTDSPKESIKKESLIGIPVMCKDNHSMYWKLYYYAGGNFVYDAGLKSGNQITFDYIIKVKDFDFNNPENSLKYNIVK